MKQSLLEDTLSYSGNRYICSPCGRRGGRQGALGPSFWRMLS